MAASAKAVNSLCPPHLVPLGSFTLKPSSPRIQSQKPLFPIVRCCLPPKGKDYGQPLFGKAEQPKSLGIELLTLPKIIPFGLIFACILLNYKIHTAVSAVTARGGSAEITTVLNAWVPSVMAAGFRSMAVLRGRAVISDAFSEFAYQEIMSGASTALIFPNLRKILGPGVDGWAMMSIVVLMGLAICFYYWWVYKFVFLPTQIYKKKENPKMGTMESFKCFVSSRNTWDFALMVAVCSLSINLARIAEPKTRSLIPLKVRSLARLVTGLLTQPRGSLITLLYYSGLLPRNVELDRFIHCELVGRENYLYHSLLDLLRCFW